MIGRALRRQSYDLNDDQKFNVEYADVLGIPFDFNAKPVVAPPQPPRETILVRAVRPERDHLEIRFPRVSGYRVELPEERLTALTAPNPTKLPWIAASLDHLSRGLGELQDSAARRTAAALISARPAEAANR